MVYVRILCKRYLQLKITAVILAIRPYTPLEMLKQTWIIDHLLHDSKSLLFFNPKDIKQVTILNKFVSWKTVPADSVELTSHRQALLHNVF